jgi:hypothetical protein
MQFAHFMRRFFYNTLWLYSIYPHYRIKNKIVGGKIIGNKINVSYQFSNYVEFKLAKFLQLIGTVKRTIF